MQRVNQMNGWEERPVDRDEFERSAASLAQLEADVAPDVLEAGRRAWVAAYDQALERTPGGLTWRASRPILARSFAWASVETLHNRDDQGAGSLRERTRAVVVAALRHFLEGDLTAPGRGYWATELSHSMELADGAGDSYAFEVLSRMALDWVRVAGLWSWEIRLHARRALRAESHGHLEEATQERLAALSRAADFLEQRSPTIEQFMFQGATETEARATMEAQGYTEAMQWTGGDMLAGVADLLGEAATELTSARSRVVTRLRALPLGARSAASYGVSLAVAGDMEAAAALATRCERDQAAVVALRATIAVHLDTTVLRLGAAQSAHDLAACQLARSILAARDARGAVSRAAWGNVALAASGHLRATVNENLVGLEAGQAIDMEVDPAVRAQFVELQRRLDGRDEILDQTLLQVREGFGLTIPVDELRAAALPVWLAGLRSGSFSNGFDIRPLIAHITDPDLAIALTALDVLNLERQRGELALSDTTRFFDSARTKRAYEGLLAALLRRGGPGDAERALVVSELARARQFRELTGRGQVDATAALSNPVASAAALRARIPSGVVALSYKFIGADTVVLAATTSEVRMLRLSTPAAELRLLGRASNQALNQRSDDALSQLRALGAALIDPLTEVLRGASSLVVVTDGELALVPFEALQVASGAYLIEEFIIAYLPSLELLEPSPRQHAPALLAFADPVYPMVPSTVPDARPLTRGAGSQIPPLPETRDEVLAIAQHFPVAGSRVLLGADARESALDGLGLREFGYLHFATHGVLDGEYPGLHEPALILAAEGGRDSLLTAYEVQRLDLAARVTVLSACNTGTGRLYAGEGAMGLSRAFLIAGSETVVVSLWQVPSVETTELMIAFYEQLSQGHEPAQALRLAKIGFLRARGARVSTARRGMVVRDRPAPPPSTTEPQSDTDERQHPHFWSAFIVIGGRVGAGG